MVVIIKRHGPIRGFGRDARRMRRAKLMLGNSILFSVVVALSLGLLCGSINRIAITKGRTPPFVATLGISPQPGAQSFCIRTAAP